MHSKTESSLAQSVTSDSCSENNYSLCDSYDAEVAYKHTPETSKYAQALNKKGKDNQSASKPLRKTTAKFRNELTFNQTTQDVNGL